MKSGTATVLVANKSASYGAERILAIVLGLKQEIKDREADFELLLKRTVEETQATTRKEVTQTLLNRFDLEISRLQAAFDRRLREVVDETEALAQAKLESALTEAKETLQKQEREKARSKYESMVLDSEKLIEKLKQDTIAAATEWQAERQRLEMRIAGLERTLDTVNAARTDKLDEHKELERKLNEALQANTQLQSDLHQAVAELISRAQAEATSETDRAVHGEVAALVQSEMIRVRTFLDEIETKLADPSTELGSEMRLNRERGELQAYLKGLRYSLGESSLQRSRVEDASCHSSIATTGTFAAT